MRFFRVARWLILLEALLSPGSRLRAQSFEQSVGSASSQASEAAIKFRQDHLAPHPTEVIVADPWSDATMRRSYQMRPADGFTQTWHKFLVDESPVAVVRPFIDAVVESFSQSDAEKIASHCKTRFEGSWDQIGCISKEIYKRFRESDVRFPQSSFCRANAYAFRITFKTLGIKKSEARSKEAPFVEGGHVVNAITVTNDTSLTYSYVIDSGNFPGVLFPLNPYAVEFHDRDRDGGTDFHELPAIDANHGSVLGSPIHR